MAATYDLILLIDASAEDEQRARALEVVRGHLGGDGKEHQQIDNRPLAYEMKKKKQAELHLFAFDAEPALLEALDRDLKITDGVLRHRLLRHDESRGMPPAMLEPSGGDVEAGGEGADEDDRERPRGRGRGRD